MLQCIVMGVEGKFYFHTIFEFSDLRVLKLPTPPQNQEIMLIR
jgi:hypothetical protein